MLLDKIGLHLVSFIHISMNDELRFNSYVFIGEQWYIESRNVIVRLHGQSGKKDALLINAHYGKYVQHAWGKIRYSIFILKNR